MSKVMKLRRFNVYFIFRVWNMCKVKRGNVVFSMYLFSCRVLDVDVLYSGLYVFNMYSVVLV